MMHRGLLLGDLTVLTIVTLAGFATHGELDAAFLPRILAALVPLGIGWFLLAPWLGLFQDATIRAASELWRPGFAMLFAGPLAVVLRGIMLNSPVIPTFAVVLTLTAAVAMTAWRALWLLLSGRTPRRS